VAPFSGGYVVAGPPGLRVPRIAGVGGPGRWEALPVLPPGRTSSPPCGATATTATAVPASTAHVAAATNAVRVLRTAAPRARITAAGTERALA
jgi:hypothetical protein